MIISRINFIILKCFNFNFIRNLMLFVLNLQGLIINLWFFVQVFDCYFINCYCRKANLQFIILIDLFDLLVLPYVELSLGWIGWANLFLFRWFLCLMKLCRFIADSLRLYFCFGSFLGIVYWLVVVDL